MKPVIFICFLLISGNLIAQESTPSFTVVKKGESAPFDGYLMTREAVVKMSVDRQYELLRKELELSLDKEKELKQKQFEIDSLKIEIESLKKERELITDVKNNEINKLNEIITKAPNDFSYAWYAGGVLSGVVTSIAIFWVAVQASN